MNEIPLKGLPRWRPHIHINTDEGQIKFKIISYDEHTACHVCVDESENMHQIDLLIDGSLGKISPWAIIGKIVTMDRLVPYIEIAMCPQIVDESVQPTEVK